MKILIRISVLIVLVAVGCTNGFNNYEETNKILHTLINHNKDITAVHLQRTDSLKNGKIKTTIKTKEPDSVAVYYKTVDSLRFKIPISQKDLLQYDLFKDNTEIDSLLSASTIEQWNEEMAHYSSHNWNQVERRNLPIIEEKPENIQGFYSSTSELKEIFYYSDPFLNQQKTKALIYEVQFSNSGQEGQLYVLKKSNKRWNIIYEGKTFITTF